MRYGVAFLAVFAAFSIKLALNPMIEEGSSFLLMSVAVLVGAVFGGLGPGVFATFVAAVLGDYFFLAPRGTFTPPGFEHGLRTTFFVVQGIAISGIGAVLGSARRRTEAALESSRRAEESYRGIFENAVDGIFRATGDGRLLTANPALASMLGYESPKDLLHGASNYARLYAEPARGEEFMELLSRGGETRGFEIRLRRKDGGEIWASVSSRVVRGDEEGRMLFEGIIEEVTERKREQERQRLLSEAGSELASSLDYEHSLSSVARLCVPDFADWCAVDMISEDGGIRRLAVEHQDPEMARWAHELQRRYPPDPDARRWLPRVLRSGEAEFYPEVTDEVLAAAIEDEEQRGILRRVGFTSVMIVPMIARERVLGAITLVTAESGRRYEQRDLNLAGELARRAAVAVDNAGLYGALRQSDDRYRTFIEQATEGIWRFEIEEPIPTDLPEDEQVESFYRHAYLAECNDAMARMYGYSRAEELEGARLGDMLPRSIPENIEYLADFLRSGYSLSGVESRKFDREGNPRFFLNNLTGIVEDGLLVRAWGTRRDITERKQVEESLRRSEQRFRVTFEQAAVGVAHVGLDGSWLRVNQRLCDIVGYGREELLEMTFQDITYPDDLEADLGRLHQLLAGEISRYAMEKRYFRKNGSVVWINLTVSLVRDEAGEPDYLVSVIEDISDRKEAEVRYRTLVEQIPAITYIQDAASNAITYLSPQFEEVMGYSSEEFLENSDLREETIHPEDYEWVLAEGRRTNETGEPFAVEYRKVRRDGRVVWVREEAILLRDAEGKPLYWQGIFIDITERRETEDRLREAREAEQVRIAQDLHDTVLQDMAFAVQEINVRHILAEGRGEEDPELEGIAETLRRGIESLRAAVFELRLQGEAEGPFAGAVESLVDLNRRMARHRFTIELNVGEDVSEHLSGTARVEITRIIQEALSNVRKHSGARHVQVSLGSEGDDLWVEVSDDGRGFNPDSFPGGLGTSSMRDRARRLGGELWVTSRPEEGTSVFFRAPRESLLGGEQGV